MVRYLLGAVMFVIGAVSAMQPPVNAALGRRTGALEASTVSFAVGTIALLALVVLMRDGSLREAVGAPWWQLTGGLMGALFVTSAVILVPRLGATGVVAGSVAGQLAGGLLIDQLGLFGLTRQGLTPVRLAGVVLLALGGMLIVRR